MSSEAKCGGFPGVGGWESPRARNSPLRGTGRPRWAVFSGASGGIWCGWTVKTLHPGRNRMVKPLHPLFPRLCCHSDTSIFIMPFSRCTQVTTDTTYTTSRMVRPVASQ